MRPLQLKGYMRPEPFSQAVLSLMGNTLLPEDGKGVMVALRPATGLRAEQAMTLCHLRRFGDVMTVVQGRLVLFLHLPHQRFGYRAEVHLPPAG